MSKHTPGPWVVAGHIGHDKGVQEYITPAHEPEICIATVWPEKHQRADARLIAAAPDLLRSLTDILDSLLFDVRPAQVVLDDARAIVARATGELAERERKS